VVYYRRACSSSEFGPFRSTRLEVIASLAVSGVELISDHRKPHRVRAVKKLTVFNRVKTDVGGDLRRAAAVPARAMAGFRFRHDYFASCGLYSGGSADPSPKKKSSICRAIRSWASFCQGIRRYSLRIIFIRSSQSFHASIEMFS
jgi:hypothetical protein